MYVTYVHTYTLCNICTYVTHIDDTKRKSNLKWKKGERLKKISVAASIEEKGGHKVRVVKLVGSASVFAGRRSC